MDKQDLDSDRKINGWLPLVAVARGVNWDSLTDAEREEMIDTLLHEPD